ncbi:MAG: hypothetical protein LC725_06710 [Lentisphaerae bacterium]|nr:hypothetical protein [Lentisphaerota bacterium]
MKHRGIIMCWLLAGIVLLGAAGVWRERLSQPRAPVREFVPPPADMPPSMLFTTVALGGFRGIIADMLWMRLIHLQQTGAPLEIVQLSRWITALEPHFARVWAFHAWNLSYNISVMFSEPEDRWRWVRHGISLLRDRALVYNPDHPVLLRELGWIYQHKIGFVMDSAHQYYKARLAEEMHDLFAGAGPDYNLLREQPELAELVEKHHLQPRIMEELDREYGPFDWRLPATHALYWSYQGRAFPSDLEGVRDCHQMFVQCMAASFRGGRLHFNRATGLYLVTPAPELLEPALRAHEEALAVFDHPVFHFAYASFLAEAVVILYSFNRLEPPAWRT